MTIFIISYLLCGATISFLAGLFGIGGGIIGIPALFTLFNLQGMPENTAMHMAVGTFLATVIITSASSAYAHHRVNNILYPIFRMMILGVTLGCLIGIAISSHLSGIWLQRIFGVFLLLIAMQSLFNTAIKSSIELPDKKNIFFSASVIGIFCGMLGLGGGVFIVPYLNRYGVPIRNAIATATACIFPIAIVGTLGYMLSGIKLDSAPAYSSGFVYWPAFLCISVASVVFAPIGVKVSRLMSGTLLKKLFSVCVAVAGVGMLLHK